ncbi:MAG TPA: DegT/DnrJ/EryC1/StrS family aminotransferase [Terracidiphilus sp.]|nr:DegT/DnrJ/EryC1/StrS family aminotransferase [Terracidiphilus sp.]
MSHRIPLSAPDITEAEIAAVNAVLRSPQLCMGPEQDAFERALATYHGIPHAVAVSSGTAGLHLSLLTLEIGEGDEVILPSFAFIAVANMVHHVRATPVFVDIDPVTLNLSPAAVERAITPRTRAILAVHTFGVPAPMLELRAIADRHNLVIVEDACEALGASLDGQRAGAFGDLAVFGFYPNKQITTAEGGAVLTRDAAHAERVRSLGNQGRAANRSQPANHASSSADSSARRQNRAEAGFNYRLSELACAMGRVQMARLDEILALRRAAAERYQQLLGGIEALALPPLRIPGGEISWFVYVVRLAEDADRDAIQAALAARGIATARYFEPIHLQPAWSSHPGVARANLPVTESMGGRTLALPFFNRITAGQQADVAEALHRALQKI